MKDTYMEDLEMIYDVLVEIRDILSPKPPPAEVFDSALFPNDLGPCTVGLCTDKAALIDFEADDLGKLFVPFSKMPAGIRKRCENRESFAEFFVGDWIYERLKEQTREIRVKEDRTRFLGSPSSDSDIPF